MRSIVLLLGLLAIAAGVAFAIPLLAGETDSPTVPEPEPEVSAKETPTETARIKTPSKEVQVDEASTAAERRKWKLLRPPAEQLLPDPDGIGPCPPRTIGGHPAPVIRRYINPVNGFHVWEHVDGAQTWIHWSPEEVRDDGTRFRRRIVSTVVPTEPLPIAPDENVKK